MPISTYGVPPLIPKKWISFVESFLNDQKLFISSPWVIKWTRLPLAGTVLNFNQSSIVNEEPPKFQAASSAALTLSVAPSNWAPPPPVIYPPLLFMNTFPFPVPS